MNQTPKLHEPMNATTNSSLSLSYTAPKDTDFGQQRAVLILEGPPLELEAVCLTELVLPHPPGQTLRLASAKVGLGFVADRDSLVIHLPAEEAEFDLTVNAEPSGAVGVILLRTKRVHSKPEPPLRASFQ